MKEGRRKYKNVMEGSKIWGGEVLLPDSEEKVE